jgi:hypothetical protein
MPIFTKREEDFVLGQDILPGPFNSLFDGIYTDLNLLAVDFYGSSEPTSTAYGMKWHDTGETPNVIRVYTSGDTDRWLWMGIWIGAEVNRPSYPATGAIWIDSGNDYYVYVYTGSAWQATGISAASVVYDNTDSGLTAEDVKSALDEIVSTISNLSSGDVSYDNTDSGLTATDVKNAIDEIVSNFVKKVMNSTLNANDNLITNIKRVSFEDFHDLGNSGTAIEVDLSQGQNFILTLTGDCTLTVTNADVGGYEFFIQQDATGGRTLTLPSGYWAGGSAYVPTTTANAIDRVFGKWDGTNWWWSVPGLDCSIPT